MRSEAKRQQKCSAPYTKKVALASCFALNALGDGTRLGLSHIVAESAEVPPAALLQPTLQASNAASSHSPKAFMPLIDSLIDSLIH